MASIESLGIFNRGRRAYQSPDEIYRAALVERARREVQSRQKSGIPLFGNWLPQATPAFTWTWPHLRYVQNLMDKISRREIRRLMIALPPRHGKSEQVTIRYPAYDMERDPTERIVVAAYGATLAESFSRKTRAIVRARGLVELDPERQSVADWRTREGGGLRAVGVGGAITGMGAHLILIDDPVKSREEVESAAFRDKTWNWYTDDLYTRQEPNAAIVLQMTRWHHDDLAGRILEMNKEWAGTSEEWVVVSLPAICEGTDPIDYPDNRSVGDALCPERYDVEELVKFERTLGRSFLSLYQQRPTPQEGDIFKRDWFEDSPGKTASVNQWPLGKRTQVWDTALDTKQTNDFSSLVEGLVHDNGYIYVAAMENSRLGFPELVRSMRNHRDRIDSTVDVCVENKASGKPARQSLRQEGVPVIEIDPGTIDKVVRAKSITNFCESKMVKFVNVKGNLNNDLIDQLLVFPNAAHDDLVDAFVHLLRRLTSGARKWRAEDFAKFNPAYKNLETVFQ